MARPATIAGVEGITIGETVSLLRPPFDLGFLHYASDTPYSKGMNLGSRNLSYFGMDPTYATSLATARRILLTLEELGYVRVRDGAFSLTPRVIGLGMAVFYAITNLPSAFMPPTMSLRPLRYWPSAAASGSSEAPVDSAQAPAAGGGCC